MKQQELLQELLDEGENPPLQGLLPKGGEGSSLPPLPSQQIVLSREPALSTLQLPPEPPYVEEIPPLLLEAWEIVWRELVREAVGR